MMGKRRRTIDSDPVFQAGQDLENWPTLQTDMQLTFDILARHQKKTGYLKFIESVRELGEDGEQIEVIFPAWIHELQTRFQEIHGDVNGEIIFQKALRALLRYLAVSGQQFEIQ